jgi:hypothetical protein
MVARKLVESEVPSNQKRAIRGVAKRGARSGRNPLLQSKRLKALPVVPKDAVFRAHPNETHAVLVDLPDREVIEAFCDPKVAEIVFLSTHDPGRQQQEGEYAREREASTLAADEPLAFRIRNYKANHETFCRFQCAIGDPAQNEDLIPGAKNQDGPKTRFSTHPAWCSLVSGMITRKRFVMVRGAVCERPQLSSSQLLAGIVR